MASERAGERTSSAPVEFSGVGTVESGCFVVKDVEGRGTEQSLSFLHFLL